jgi:hypothetical protein
MPLIGWPLSEVERLVKGTAEDQNQAERRRGGHSEASASRPWAARHAAVCQEDDEEDDANHSGFLSSAIGVVAVRSSSAFLPTCKLAPCASPSAPQAQRS